MATVGDILDEFFSPFSSERLWVMPGTDGYTVVVRRWRPVIDAANRTKAHLAANCAQWSAGFVTNPAWRPTMTDVPKPGSYREFVASPPGTDPDTCLNAFVLYAMSKAARTAPRPIFIPLPEIQTENLYTCSIGSFNIYTTVDRIDCAAKTATVNYWMYNAMSRRSFGRFASHPAFALSGMATQYMWWNWVDSVDWSSGTIRTLPSVTSTGRW
jgi:hypothetical protein